MENLAILDADNFRAQNPESWQRRIRLDSGLLGVQNMRANSDLGIRI